MNPNNAAQLTAGSILGGAQRGRQLFSSDFPSNDGNCAIARSRLGDEAARLELLAAEAGSLLERLTAIAGGLDGDAPSEKSCGSAPIASGHLSRVSCSIGQISFALDGIAKQVERLRGLVG